ncbi:YciI family protein [Knoellia subterranea]|uniref:Transcription initiation protein n=1 Tax=Knoellia subterranea KCTC 19937 TaxID=1385521 RepID=A0A0A0JJE7_9MICO|nr:YciI family protein [Knoellia subterranea]KGN36177.1 transcription initiation protein [Knoellia subterranea KCTC 19937]
MSNQATTTTTTAPTTTALTTTTTTTPGGEPREYVVLIVGDPDRWWTSMTDEERQNGYAVYGRFSEQLAERGHTVTGGAELHGRASAKSIPTGGGPVVDGPFAESVEHVGGFYQIVTSDLDDLLDCCQQLAAIGEGIEVRPVVTDEERQS